MKRHSQPVIAIVGRPNVGKSTLFNRLFGNKRALVHDFPGVTRDRLELPAVLEADAGRFEVQLIDTGGLEGDRFRDEIENQVRIALEKADVILMVFDAQVGLQTDDEEVLRKLNRSGALKRAALIGVVNKVDHPSHERRADEFYAMGLDDWVLISAEHGDGIADLKELLARAIKKAGFEAITEVDPIEEDAVVPESRTPRIAIVGRPNVGKSTLTNFLIGEERMITSPIAGTTVDRIDSEIEIDGRKMILIDTAGIRRKSKTERGVEVLSVVQAKKALETADVALLLLDGVEGPTDQDEKIGGLIEESGCSVLILLNKWDTMARSGFTQEEARERILKQMAFLRFAPILFTSAKKGTGLQHLGELITDILDQRSLKLSTKELTSWIRDEARIHNPMNAKFYLFQQTGRHPPSFTAFVSDPKKVHFSLKRHLVNAMREKWGFMGTPIRMHFLKAQNQSERED